MPGESILIIDNSLAIQEIAEAALVKAGYRVTTASNGAAALTYPGIEEVDLIVLDSEMPGVDGEETARVFKQHAATHPIPLLMMVNETKVPKREDYQPLGASGYILKPFDGRELIHRVSKIFDQHNLDELARQYTANAAEQKMEEIATQAINEAVERKTQIIIERSIQRVATTVDQRARQEVEEKVATLTSEKEQELVRTTVREVAQSMVEKLAERKVEEAMQTILEEQTERAIKRATDTKLPGLMRERLKEMVANMLPREIETRVQKSTERLVPEIGEQLIGTIENVANKTIPRLARELLPGIIEQQVTTAIDESLPRRVRELVARELQAQMPQKIDPAIQEAMRRVRKTLMVINGILGAAVVAGLGAAIFLFLQSRG